MKWIMLLTGILVVTVWIIPIEVQSEKILTEEEVMKICDDVGEQYCICPELLFAIAERESRLHKNAKNGTCKGLMQVSEKWHSDRMKKLGVKSLYDPEGNILVAADYISELADQWEDLAMVLDIYHGDSNAMWNYENGIVSKYAQGIIDRTKELEAKHGKLEE